jgi:hypothetical protein
VVPIALASAVTLPQPGRVELVCQSTSSASTNVVAYEAGLVATRVTDIRVQ